jgi:hypothetical protein
VKRHSRTSSPLNGKTATLVYLIDPSDEERFTSVQFILGLRPSKSFSARREHSIAKWWEDAEHVRDPRWRRLMKCISFLLGTFLIASIGNAALAQSCPGGQKPAPAALAAQLALPSCGFAATESWGRNGCQWCDARDMHPNPFGPRAIPQGESSHFRGAAEFN